MNIVLFEADELQHPLPLQDPRARHVLEVLRRGPGDNFDAGVIGGPRGKATVERIDADSLHLSFGWGVEPPPLEPLTLIIGLPRPQTARKILEEATSLGVEAMHFVLCERGDPGYGQSRLWSSGEWRRHVIAGAAQAFTTRLPVMTWGLPLGESIDGLAPAGTRLALDNYEAPQPLSKATVSPPVTLAIGPERGWSTGERERLRAHDFAFVHLGERVLRVETATTAAIALVRAHLGSM